MSLGIAALLLTVSGCDNDCRKWCEKWTVCQKEEAEKAGIKKFEYDCIDKCESKSKTQSGYRTLERKMTCVDKPCSEIPACLRAK